MAFFKCKICGGSLEIDSGLSVVTCEYCGTKQTLPKLDNDRRENLYDRANHFRRNNDFDKAMGIYENILNEDNTDAEAYWSIVLCRYGIEYVDDPSTHRHMPTVNRAQFTSIFDDEDYKSAIKYADTYQREIYETEANTINEIQKGILAISQKEEPFDVFVCYKETDTNGRRTQDSVLAQELYFELKKEGLKVFFSRITLEDKLGIAYEPYIFAALHSAKVMVVLGTRSEHFNAVWVKNEWSRYLALIKNGAKKTLIPAYRDMDPYDLPEEFSHLQAQDMSKLGFMQDLIRGIKKIVPATVAKESTKEAPKSNESAKEVPTAPISANIAPLVKRIFLFLEEEDYQSAEEYCEKVLDIDPECAQAYLAKLLIDLNINNAEELATLEERFDDNINYRRAVKYGDDKLKEFLKKAHNDCVENIVRIEREERERIARIEREKRERQELKRLESIYVDALSYMSYSTESAFLTAAEMFKSIHNYKDSALLAKKCQRNAEELSFNDIYNSARNCMGYNQSISSQHEAIDLFKKIPGWKDSNELILQCQKNIEDINKAKEEARIEKERKAEQARIKAKERANRIKKIAIIVLPIVVLIFALIIVYGVVIKPQIKYNNALDLMAENNFERAISIFEDLGKYKDCSDKISECNAAIIEIKYNEALELMNSQKYEDAIAIFNTLNSYKDSNRNIDECNMAISEIQYNKALELMDSQKYEEAIATFKTLDGYKNSNSKIDECNTAILDKKYNEAISLMNSENHDEAMAILKNLNGYKDSTAKINQLLDIKYSNAEELMNNQKYVEALAIFRSLNGYKESAQKIISVYQSLQLNTISAGKYHTVGVTNNGDALAAGDNNACIVTDWSNIIAVSAGTYHTVGLKSNGNVVAVGSSTHGQIAVRHWTNVIAISAGEHHSVGLKSDGTVVAVGDNAYGQCSVYKWEDIVAISAGANHTVGLKADGTVVAVGDNDSGQCNVSKWKDIVAISAGANHTIGLKADGTVVAVGDTTHGKCNVSNWKDIIAISAGTYHTVGLKADGTVVAVGNNAYGQCSVSKWNDIVAISAGASHTIGLKSNGTVVAVGNNISSQCDVSRWNNIKTK